MKSKLIPSESFQVSEVKISYHPKVNRSQLKQIHGASDSFQILLNDWDAGKIHLVEQFKVLLLNHGNKVLGIFEVSSGGMSSTVVDVRILFSTALLANAAKIILAHNHPSGNLRPSTADCRLTKQIKDAGDLLNIEVLDHLIITSEAYLSFAEEGLL